MLLAFVGIVISAAFWSIYQGESLLKRDDNARNVIAEQRIRRGTIYDRDGMRLAYSQETASGVMRRVYPQPAVASAVGYYSLTYGTAGIEAAFDNSLRGADRQADWEQWINSVLHRVPQGSDVWSTIDLDVQLATNRALHGRHGAAVVVEVPSGRVLALVSQPAYDPNRLDADWDTLTANKETSPLLNRATAGAYQPGGAFQTIMLAALLAENPDLAGGGELALNSEVADAQTPLQVRGLTLTCLPGTPDRSLTLAEAYLYGCPAPFVATNIPLERLWQRWEMLGLLSAPTLTGFETETGKPLVTISTATNPARLEALLTGQGDLTITPLQLAQVIAVIANRGNAVPLHLVEATRPPESSTWRSINEATMQPALLRADVAAALRLAMLQSAARSPCVEKALRGEQVLYGHCALAYGGPDESPSPLAWFAGFVEQPSRSGTTLVLAVVVIENESDPSAAADAAGAAFQAASLAPLFGPPNVE
jgi:peptidoglycan glycosyltransferase